MKSTQNGTRQPLPALTGTPARSGFSDSDQHSYRRLGPTPYVYAMVRLQAGETAIEQLCRMLLNELLYRSCSCFRHPYVHNTVQISSSSTIYFSSHSQTLRLHTILPKSVSLTIGTTPSLVSYLSLRNLQRFRGFVSKITGC
jgi:hypothetical protein